MISAQDTASLNLALNIRQAWKKRRNDIYIARIITATGMVKKKLVKA
jgi:hypothetical protein